MNSKIKNIKKLLFFLYILAVYIWGGKKETTIYSEVILIVLLGLELIDILKTRKIKFAIPIMILLIFDIYCFLSNFWAINRDLSLVISKTLFLLCAFVWISYNMFTKMKDGHIYILKAICWAGIIFSLYIMFYYGITNYFTKLLAGQRIGTEINNVNAIGLQTCISVIICIFFGLYENKKIYYIISIIPLIISLGTGSRKVLLMILLGIICLFIFMRNRGSKKDTIRIIKKLAILIIIIIIAWNIMKMPMFSMIFNRFESMVNGFTGNGKVDASTTIRKQFIQAGLEQFIETPILGIGVNNSSYVTLKATNDETYLHNNFVELLACTGIIGFLLYYSVFIYLLYELFRYVKTNNNFAIINFIILAVNIILDYGVVSYYGKNTYIYILLAMVTIEKLKEGNQNEQNN